MSEIKEYVLGFGFSRNKEKVVLIEKQRPEWQKGKYNGVGGKVEPEDSSIISAMIREFEEETSVTTFPDMWQHFATMVFKNDVMGGEAHVHCLRMFSNVIYQCITNETEEIFILDVNEVNSNPIIKNLYFLIPMALDEDILLTEINLA